jgi:alpha-1,3-mannosyltransferase
MRILHVTRQFFPAIGGIESVIWHLSHHLQACGHEVSVVTLNRLFEDRRCRLLPEEVVDDIVIQRMPFIGPRRYAVAPTVLSYIEDCDVVHLHSSDFFLDYLALTKWLHKKPLILSTHGLFFHTTFAQALKQLYFRTVTRGALSRVSAVACVSQHDFELLSSIVPTAKLQVIPNGIEYNKLSAFNVHYRDPDLLISVGRLADNKRVDRLLRTFARVVKQRPTTKLVLIGPDWGLQSSLKALSTSLGIDKQVEFLGRVSDEDLLMYLSQASVWLSASEYESFGVALLEAMASGCVPIVQPLAAFKQLMQANVEGFYADYENPELAASMILSALSLSSDERAEMIENARAKASQFSWRTVTKEFDELYAKVVRGASRAYGED